MRPYIDAGSPGGLVRCGDAVEVMRSMREASVDTIVTDPPGGINFMNRNWDSDKGGRDEWVAWLAGVMRECLRVLKPGGMALVWAIPRTSHWTATAIEDAGFEIREKIYHIFGSGFPKSLDIGKAIDRMKGAERKIIREGFTSTENDQNVYGTGLNAAFRDRRLTAPATPEARTWDGWGTATKPSVEEWVLAMKPLDGSFAQNALRHGLAGLNIDGSRIGTETITAHGGGKIGDRAYGMGKGIPPIPAGSNPHQGRWPANLLLSHHELCREIGVKKVKSESGGDLGIRHQDAFLGVIPAKGELLKGRSYAKDGTETIPAYECAVGCPCGHVWATKELTECPECGCRKAEWLCAVRMLDEQSGKSSGGKRDTPPNIEKGGTGTSYIMKGQKSSPQDYPDSGGASRFFYTAKASRSERERGLRGRVPCARCGNLDSDHHADEKGEKVPCVRNDHPTVKSLAIMEYLVRLTMTPTGGLVLDPFCGSGSTLVACKRLGREFIGIDSDARACDITVARLEGECITPARATFGL